MKYNDDPEQQQVDEQYQGSTDMAAGGQATEQSDSLPV
jgi:hypothetical protein